MSLARHRSQLSLVFLLSASLAACGGVTPGVAAPAGTWHQNVAGRSWIDPAAKSKALLYLSDEYGGVVRVYSYPELASVGTLSGFDTPAGLCVNSENGNIWVTDTFKSEIFEFAHGGTTPIRTLKENEDYVNACAVNPKNGDLAVANGTTIGGSDPGNVVIFEHGFRSRSTYSDRSVFLVRLLGYDDDGNLFVDAERLGHRRAFRLDELPYGGTKLSGIPWRGRRLEYAGGVQYDGTSLAVGDFDRGVIYRTMDGAVTGATHIRGACYVDQFFIDGSTLIAPSFCNSAGVFNIYNYPAGGAPLKTIAGFGFPYGAVISRK